MADLHRRYGDRVEFLSVYVREAHPIDGWLLSSNEKAGIRIAAAATGGAEFCSREVL